MRCDDSSLILRENDRSPGRDTCQVKVLEDFITEISLAYASSSTFITASLPEREARWDLWWWSHFFVFFLPLHQLLGLVPGPETAKVSSLPGDDGTWAHFLTGKGHFDTLSERLARPRFFFFFLHLRTSSLVHGRLLSELHKTSSMTPDGHKKNRA